MIKKKDRDIFFTEDGDLFLDDNKNLLFSKEENDDLLLNIIQKRIQSNSTDWSLQTILTADLYDFAGAQVTFDNIEKIQNQIINCLTSDGLVKPEEISISAIPVNPGFISFVMSIKKRNYSFGDLSLSISYDMRDNKISTRYINPREFSAWQEY